MNQEEKKWVDIALDDLKSSRALYNTGHFRASYFLFQQASEKANKAFALLTGSISPEKLSDIKHDQLKIYRSNLVKEEADIKSLAKILAVHPHTAGHNILNGPQLSSYGKSLAKNISFIDKVKDLDFVNISLSDINYLYRELIKLENLKIKRSKTFDTTFKKYWKNLAEWIGGFNTSEALEAKNEYLKVIENEASIEELNSAALKMSELLLELAFVQYTFYFCAILTIQHSSLTRYPLNGKDPMTIYTRHLPLVKKQPVFMDLLEKAIHKLISIYLPIN